MVVGFSLLTWIGIGLHHRRMDLQQKFTAEIAAFLKRTGMRPTTFGREAMDDPSFVATLESGRAPNLRTIERARTFMEKNKTLRVA